MSSPSHQGALSLNFGYGPKLQYACCKRQPTGQANAHSLHSRKYAWNAKQHIKKLK